MQNGLRDGEAIRGEMHCKFIEELEKQSVPWHLISGSRAARIERAVKAVSPLIGVA